MPLKFIKGGLNKKSDILENPKHHGHHLSQERNSVQTSNWYFPFKLNKSTRNSYFHFKQKSQTNQYRYLGTLGLSLNFGLLDI